MYSKGADVGDNRCFLVTGLLGLSADFPMSLLVPGISDLSSPPSRIVADP